MPTLAVRRVPQSVGSAGWRPAIHSGGHHLEAQQGERICIRCLLAMELIYSKKDMVKLIKGERKKETGENGGSVNIKQYHCFTD